VGRQYTSPGATSSARRAVPIHDSQYSYGSDVATALGANFFNFGCTGATHLNGITAPETSNGITYRPAELTGNADYDTAAPDVVLATFGADDIQFVKIVTACIASSFINNTPNGPALVAKLGLSALASYGGPLQCVPSNPGPTVESDFFEELPALQTYYGQLAAAIEARGEAASPPKVPKVIFTNYMDPLPSGTCLDTFNLTAGQLQYLSGLLGSSTSWSRPRSRPSPPQIPMSASSISPMLSTGTRGARATRGTMASAPCSRATPTTALSVLWLLLLAVSRPRPLSTRHRRARKPSPSSWSRR
jgi:hypothetical protein